MGALTCLYLITQSICIFGTCVYIFVGFYTPETGSKIFASIWVLVTYLLMLTSLYMIVPYDDVLSFICGNCGSLDNDIQCCPSNFRICAPCTLWVQKSKNASLTTKVAISLLTGGNLMAIYIFACVETAWNISPDARFFIVFQFYGFVVYMGAIVLYRNFVYSKERAAYHRALYSDAPSGLRDVTGSATSRLT